MKRFILFNSPIFWDSTKEQEQYLSPLGLGYLFGKSKDKKGFVDALKKSPLGSFITGLTKDVNVEGNQVITVFGNVEGGGGSR